MLQLSVAILNGPGKGCSSIMVPSTANSSFFVARWSSIQKGKKLVRSLARFTIEICFRADSRFDRSAPISVKLLWR